MAEGSRIHRIASQGVELEVPLVSSVVPDVTIYVLAFSLHSEDREMESVKSILDQAGVINDGSCYMPNLVAKITSEVRINSSSRSTNSSGTIQVTDTVSIVQIQIKDEMNVAVPAPASRTHNTDSVDLSVNFNS